MGLSNNPLPVTARFVRNFSSSTPKPLNLVSPKIRLIVISRSFRWNSRHLKKRSGHPALNGMLFALTTSDADARCRATSEKMEKTRRSFVPSPSRSARILLWHSHRWNGLHDLWSHRHLQGLRRSKTDRKSVSFSNTQRIMIIFHVSPVWPHWSAINSIRQYCRSVYLLSTLSDWPRFSKVLSAIRHGPCWAFSAAGAQEPHPRNHILVPPCPGAILRCRALWPYCSYMRQAWLLVFLFWPLSLSSYCSMTTGNNKERDFK